MAKHGVPVLSLSPLEGQFLQNSSFVIKEKKVKCPLVQALRLCTGRKAHSGSRGIALPFHDHGIRREWGVRVTPGRSLPTGKTRCPLLQEAVWAPGPVWTGAENLVHSGIRSPDPPALSQSLYLLRYPAHSFIIPERKLCLRFRR